MAVKMATLPESGTKRPFRDGAIRGGHWEVWTPTTNISQENGHGMLMIEFQFVPYN